MSITKGMDKEGMVHTWWIFLILKTKLEVHRRLAYKVKQVSKKNKWCILTHICGNKHRSNFYKQKPRQNERTRIKAGLLQSGWWGFISISWKPIWVTVEQRLGDKAKQRLKGDPWNLGWQEGLDALWTLCISRNWNNNFRASPIARLEIQIKIPYLPTCKFKGTYYWVKHGTGSCSQSLRGLKFELSHYHYVLMKF